MGIGAAIVAGSVVSGYLGNKASNNASKSSSAASAASLAEQQRQFDLTRSDQAPYRQAGRSALTKLQGNIGDYNTKLPEYNRGEDFKFNLEEDAGYQFARDQAIKATDRTQASMGGTNSGNRLAEIGDRVTGVASQYANDAFNRQMGTSRENYGRNLTEYGINRDKENDMYGRRQTFLNRLSSLAGLGQTSVGQTGAAGQNFANASSNILNTNATNQGNIAIGNAQNLNNAIQGGTSNYLLSSLINKPTVG